MKTMLMLSSVYVQTGLTDHLSAHAPSSIMSREQRECVCRRLTAIAATSCQDDPTAVSVTVARFNPKVDQIGPKCDKSGTF